MAYCSDSILNSDQTLNVALAEADEGRPDVSVMIVGFDSLDYLENCLKSVYQAVGSHSMEVLFVNNGTDPSEIFLAKHFREVKLFPSIGNIGFAAANNYLAKYARGRWLLLLNPDTELYPQSIDILLDAAQARPHFQALGGISVGSDGTPISSATLELPTLKSIARQTVGGAVRFGDQIHRNGWSEPDAISGGFMMVDSAWWRHLQGMDESFFLYSEELDFFKRLKDCGGRVAQIDESKVYHEVGSGDPFSSSRMKFKFTGQAHYLHKHFSPPYAWTCVCLVWLSLTVRFVLGRIVGSRKPRLACMSAAYEPLVRKPAGWMKGYKSSGADPRGSGRQLGGASGLKCYRAG